MQVRHCIKTHRYREDNLPESLEAKILFDADKLEHIYDHFYTEKAASLAEERRQAAVDFYESLYREAASSYQAGRDALAGLLTDS